MTLNPSWEADTTDPAKQTHRTLKKVIFILIGFILFSSGFFAGKLYTSSPVVEQQPLVTPLLTQTSTISPTIQPTLTSPPIQSLTSSWKEVDDDFFRARFKIPPGYAYKKYNNTISPSDVTVSYIPSTSSTSRREAVFQHYRVTSKDVRIQERTTNNNNILLVEGLTDIADAEGLDYLGVIAQENTLMFVEGDKQYETLIKGILETLEFYGTPGTNMVDCTEITPHKEPEEGRTENGGYYASEFFTHNLDETYLKTSGRIGVEAAAEIDYKAGPPESYGKTLAVKQVAFTPTVSSYTEGGYTHKMTLTVTREEIIKQLGTDVVNQADGISLRVTRNHLKTADGKFCNMGVGGYFTTTIK